MIDEIIILISFLSNNHGALVRTNFPFLNLRMYIDTLITEFIEKHTYQPGLPSA